MATNEFTRLRAAVFGVSEHDLPAMGIAGVAAWPVIESGRTRLGAGALSSVRRQVTWVRMSRHGAAATDLELVDPPRWAARRVNRRRARAGLRPAAVRAA